MPKKTRYLRRNNGVCLSPPDWITGRRDEEAHRHSPRAFYLDRREDASGVSGTGVVAHGVEFADGQCVLWWRDSGSLGMYKSLAKLEEIHGHQGRTLVIMTGAS